MHSACAQRARASPQKRKRVARVGARSAHGAFRPPHARGARVLRVAPHGRAGFLISIAGNGEEPTSMRMNSRLLFATALVAVAALAGCPKGGIGKGGMPGKGD